MQEIQHKSGSLQTKSYKRCTLWSKSRVLLKTAWRQITKTSWVFIFVTEKIHTNTALERKDQKIMLLQTNYQITADWIIYYIHEPSCQDHWTSSQFSATFPSRSSSQPTSQGQHFILILISVTFCMFAILLVILFDHLTYLSFHPAPSFHIYI